MSYEKNRKSLGKYCTVLALVALLSACGGGGSSTSPTTPTTPNTPNTPNTPTTPTTTSSVSFSISIQPIFTAHCVSCHSSSGTAGGILRLDVGTYTNLVNRPSVVDAINGVSPAGILVVPSKSAESRLYNRISAIGLPAGELQMPLGGPFLSTDDQNLIKTWIDEGAKNN